MASNPHYNHGLLRRAIAISLLLHAVLLLQPGLGAKASHTSAGPALMALLRPRAEPQPRVATAPAAVSHAAHAPAMVREVSVAAPPVTGSAAATPHTTEEVAGVPVGSSNVSNHGNDAATPAAAAGNVGLDFAEARKSYLFAIAAEARRVKKYPPRALSAGWTGTAEIRVMVAAGGNVQAPQLHKSSSYADIDNAALSFVGIALKRTPVPESLRSRNFDFVLPVSFTINDE